MKKRILAILLAIALLSSVAGVVAYAADPAKPKCSFCSTEFENATELSNHLNTYQRTKTCPICGNDSAGKPVWSYEYSACSSTSISAAESAYNEHYKAMHSESITYHCTFKDCPYYEKYGFATAAELEAHIASTHTENTNALHCPYKDCNYIAYSISDYNNHIAANHQKDGEQVTPRDNMQRFFDKYFMGIGLNVNENSFSSVVRIFAYVTEVFMSVFTDSGASEVFQFAGDSGVTYFFETIVPHFWALFTE